MINQVAGINWFEKIHSLLPEVVQIRHQLHQLAELSTKEFATATFIRDKLQAFGYQPQTAVGGEGLVALLPGHITSRAIAVRADFDALPLQETSGVGYSSKQSGVMHACGHDGHTAIVLGLAKLLKLSGVRPPQSIKFIFQPAEEVGLGALAMIAAGVLQSPQVTKIFGLHNFPSLPAGQIAVKQGCIFTSLDRMSLQITGRGGHASMPELCCDPLAVACQLKPALEQLTGPFIEDKRAILQITQLQAGEAFNVIPATARLAGSLRTADNDLRFELKDQVDTLITRLAKDSKTDIQLEYLMQVPATVNTGPEAHQVFEAAHKNLPAGQATWLEQHLMPSEDFSYFLQEVPGCYFMLGSGETWPGLHTSHYDFNDNIIANGLRVFCELVLDDVVEA